MMKREKIIRKLSLAADNGVGDLGYLTEEAIDTIADVLSGELDPGPNPCPYTFAHTSRWCGRRSCRRS